MIPNALTIAGIDPSGGAGIYADLKSFSALGAYGTGVVAALTAQNTREVTGVQGVPPAFVRLQLDTLFADVRIDTAKIGMLAAAVASLLPQRSDPVQAVRDAKAWLTEAIRRSGDLSVGQGHGPVHHFHALWTSGGR